MKSDNKGFLKKIGFNGDAIIVTITIIFSLLSFYAVFSTPDPKLKHFVHVALCFVAMYVFYKIDYRTLSKFANIAIVFAFLLIVVTIAFGGDNKRDITLLGITGQTFYFVGFLVIFYLSKFLASKMGKGESLSKLDHYYLCGVVLLFTGLMGLANMSTAIILFITSIVVLFVGNVSPRYLLIMSAAAVVIACLFVVVDIGRGDTFKGRIEYYFTQNNENNYADQIILAKAAIARTGFTPEGPGNGVIKNSLPQRETDYAYATLFEQLGIIIGLLILFLYVVLFNRARNIAKNSEGPFGMLLALGIGFWFTIQGLVHIGVNCELIPATGQTLPFISRGGASLLFSGISIGILLNIGKNGKKQIKTQD